MRKMVSDHDLAQAIVDTIQEPLLVLDEELRVVVASRCFYMIFGLQPEDAEGRHLGALGDGQWDLPALRDLLLQTLADKTALKDWEVELSLPEKGRRIVLLNARRVFDEADARPSILLTIEDVTERRGVERERDELLHQKDMLLEEMQHRVANSLAIIAGILLMKARAVASPETRAHLEDAHSRVLSVATVQRHLHQSEAGIVIELNSYLRQLCAGLAGSMINSDLCRIDTSQVGEASVTSTVAVSIGLIVTELVINALKHAFPEGRPGCVIVVSYEVNGTDWKLSVSDNGGGEATGLWPPRKVGLGTTLVNGLAASLGAQVATTTGPSGTTAVITHSTFKSASKAA